MKRLLKEFLWLIGFYIVLVTIKNLLLPLDNPKYYLEIFMNVEDNNYFITNLEVFVSVLILGYFIIYQIRNLILKYKNQYSNFILVVSQILLIALVSTFISFAFSIKNSIALSYDQTFYVNDKPTDLNWELIFYGLLIIQMAITVLLYYNAIRITKNKLTK